MSDVEVLDIGGSSTETPEPDIDEEDENTDTESNTDEEVIEATPEQVAEVESGSGPENEHPETSPGDESDGEEEAEERGGEEAAVAETPVETQAASDQSAESEVEAESEVDAETEGATETEPGPEVAAEPEPEPEPESTPESEDEPADESSSEPSSVEENSDGSESDSEEQTGEESEEDSEVEADKQSSTFGFPRVEGETSHFDASIELGTLGEYMERVKEVVDEAKVQITNKGIFVRAVDPANVHLIETTLSAAAFETFDVKPGAIGLELPRFLDILGNANKGDLVQLRLVERGSRLKVTVDGLEYTMGTIDPDAIREVADIPQMGLPVTATCEASVIGRTIRGAKIVMNKSLTFEAEPDADALVVSAEGDTDSFHREHEQGDELISLEQEVDGSVSSNFGRDYIESAFVRIPSKSGSEVTIECGDGKPAIIKQDSNNGKIRFRSMLAPRIES